MMDKKHILFMERALELAREGVGLTRPNPPVGAVLVQDDKIIAEGYHQKAGGPHAEVNCLWKAEGKLNKAVLYVTLEPCSTQGQTPACTELILERGIRQVVIGCRDPNLVNSGKGIHALSQAGVNVVVNICRKEAEELIAPFTKRVTQNSVCHIENGHYARWADCG